MNIYIVDWSYEIRKNLWKKPYFMIIKYLKFERKFTYFLRKFRPTSAGWQIDELELSKIQF